jgi:hypothetical protein
MIPQLGSHWLTAYVDWVIKTLLACFSTVLFGALGFALWIIFQLLSVGVEGLLHSGMK